MASYFSDHNVDEAATNANQSRLTARMMELQLLNPANIGIMPADEDQDEPDERAPDEVHRLMTRLMEQLELEQPEPEGNAPRTTRNPADEETLMDRLMALQLLNPGSIEAQGTSNPPASNESVAKLPKVQFDQVKDKHSTKTCPVCTDDFTADCDITKLPCTHHYHRSCIVPWLKKTNNCPLCRYELPTDDAAYEQRKKDRQAREIAREMYDGMYN